MSSKQNKKTDEILSIIASKAALSVDGVAEFVSAPIQLNLRSKEIVKGILISNDNNKIRFDIFLNVYMGTKIPVAAFSVQETVKKAIELNTKYKIDRVNINVQGISVNEKN